jgi:hypothetical protein
MNGDFTRLLDDASKGYTGVLLQQGRVQLDADFNEAGAIQRRLVRALASDLIGPHGGPATDLGFLIDPLADHTLWDFAIGAGAYWVDGLRARNPASARFTAQPDFVVRDQDPKLAKGSYLVYLDVFERSVNGIEDPELLERALAGLDTSVRTCLTWIVRVTAFTVPTGHDPADAAAARLREIGAARPMLEARLRPDDDQRTACVTPAEARYRGLENQLYRVEVHYDSNQMGGATLKWSRENGSVVLAIESLEGATATLRELGRDPRGDVAVGDWVEILDDDARRLGVPQPLVRVKQIDRNARQITFDNPPEGGFGQQPAKHPFVRRWDQRQRRSDLPLADGTIAVGSDSRWIALEDGIEVRVAPWNGTAPTFRSGDYWLIPARVTGEIVWPQAVQPPHGVEHRFAPLALVTIDGAGTMTRDNDLRKKFAALAT